MARNSLQQPAPIDVALFVAHLVRNGNAYKRGVAFATIDKYVTSVLYMFEAATQVRLQDEAVVRLALKGARRTLGDARQRARPLALAELGALMAGPLRGDHTQRWARRRFVYACAFWGALRLSAFYQHALTWSGIERDGRGLVVTLESSKTAQYGERRHRFLLAELDDKSVCPVAAYDACVAAGIVTPMELVAAGLDVDALLASAREIVPSRRQSKWEKGHLTLHSFRRGFVQFAIALGIPAHDVMTHGDWKSIGAFDNYVGDATVVLEVASRMRQRV